MDYCAIVVCQKDNEMIEIITFEKEADALKKAWETSTYKPDWLVYVFFSMSSGKYVIDYTGIVYSDEKLIATFYKGEKQ